MPAQPLARRTVLTAAGTLAGTAVVALTGLASPARAAVTRGRVLARDLRIPWGLAFLPNGDALVTERETGRVHRVRRGGGRRRVGTIAGVDLSDGAGEGGLLGLCLSPDFASDRQVYLYLTTADDNRVIRVRYAGGGLSARTDVLTGIPRGFTHNGGRIAFGPDGKLYVATGDTREERLAQDTDSLAGKILRLEPDGAPAAGNPFGNEVWSYGHRNVQGLAWGPDGRMWATELGENRTDELNRIRPGRDYGWPQAEGPDGPGGGTDPFVTWSPTSTCSPSGLAVTRGRAWVAALQGECLYSVKLGDPGRKRIRRHLAGELGRIRTVEVAPDGSLWVCTSNGRNDRVVRVLLD